MSNESPRTIPLKPEDFSKTSERLRPTNNEGIATKKPAIGPAAPIWMSADLLVIADFIFIKAPKVPIKNINGGAGIKYGYVASTLCLYE